MSVSSAASLVNEVLFFGGTGNIGSDLLFHGLLSSKYSHQFHVTVVVRSEKDESKEDPDSQRKVRVQKLLSAGVKFIEFNFEGSTPDDDNKLQQIIRGKQFIVSVLQGGAVEHQRRILAAAQIVGGIKLFVPAEFAFDTDNMTAHSPSSIFKMAFARELEKSSVPFARIVTGLFTEYLFVPNSGVDVANRTIHTVNDPKDIHLTVTAIRDSATCLAEILLHSQADYVKNQVVRLGFQTVSWSDVIQNVRIALKSDSTQSDNDLKIIPHTVDELQTMIKQGGLTATIARFQLVFQSQAGVYWNEKDEKLFLQKHKSATGFELQPYTVEQYAMDAFGPHKKQ